MLAETEEGSRAYVEIVDEARPGPTASIAASRS